MLAFNDDAFVVKPHLVLVRAVIAVMLEQMCQRFGICQIV
jgi:hypothetical protein